MIYFYFIHMPGVLPIWEHVILHFSLEVYWNILIMWIQTPNSPEKKLGLLKF